MQKEEYKRLAIVAIFAIAMAFLESTVVVYLRRIYYPDGFDFPLKGFIEPNILLVEWVREAFTIIMLIAIAVLAVRKFYPRLAYFLYAFAVWDIFYYIWLKVSLNWPASFLTWDLLYMIPIPWIGPVLAPIICSVTMIILALLILNFNEKIKSLKISAREWALLIAGATLILYTFMYDYSLLIFQNGFAKDFFSLAVNPVFMDIISSYLPKAYNWTVFIIGESLILVSIVLFYLRNKR